MEASKMEPLRQDGYNAMIRQIRATSGCQQCQAHRQLRLLRDGNDLYASGQRIACRNLLEVPHSCNIDYMNDFVLGEVVPAPRGVYVQHQVN